MSVILINPFEVPEGKEREALAFWDMAAEFFRQQPGFISTRLHKAIVPWARFSLINVAEWESVPLYESALNSEEYRKLAERSRDVARYYPGLYEVVRT
jgi:heme oxygenase (mycobilin-producing)